MNAVGRVAVVAAAFIAAGSAAARVVAGSADTQPPHAVVDTRPVAQRGRVVTVAAGDNLQAVLEHARGGDTIVLPAGATFKGPLTVPRVPGEGWIEIRSAGADGLPPGRRVSPGDAPKMARIVGGDGASPAIRTAP
ncbi:MAG TPA: hypothetical protein VFQ62_05205, partial [Methylomirabilota bacterium]|nr:hypothetical protein [Methylomirabilota bacterium]